MKYCPECGYELKDKTRFCPECGCLLPEDLEDKDPSLIDIPTEGRKILIEWYEQTVDASMSYRKLVLYTYSKKELLLEESNEWKQTRKLVPYDAYTEALEVVKTFHLKELLNRKGFPMMGKKMVIRFRETEEDERLYQFSTDNVGRDETMMMFPEMLRVLTRYR